MKTLAEADGCESCSSGKMIKSEENTVVVPAAAAAAVVVAVPRKIKVKTKGDGSEGSGGSGNAQAAVPRFDVIKNITSADDIGAAIREVKEAQEKNKSRIQQGAVPELCTECREALPNFMIPHLPSACPVRNSLYCGFCSRYGHTSKTCDVAPPPWATKVAYVEQLVPTDAIKEYKITTKTPLDTHLVIPPPTDKIPNGPETIEIREDDKIIKAWLRARGVPATENHRKNKELLQQFADRHGRVLVYLP